MVQSQNQTFFPLEANRQWFDSLMILGCSLDVVRLVNLGLPGFWSTSESAAYGDSPRGDRIRHVLSFLIVPRTRKQGWPRAGHGEGRFTSVSFSPELGLPSFFPACLIAPGLQPSS